MSLFTDPFHEAARQHLLSGHPIYVAAPGGYPAEQIKRIYPDGRQEIVCLDRDAEKFVVIEELETLAPECRWWSHHAGLVK
ncbi:hypothetical protein ACT2FY_39095 [Paraburkholderia fungorum]|uniref:hypothetical protein n=1 Tax=Paraburkholderia fungorum TaxID=134537 RepID=UPI00402B92AD